MGQMGQISQMGFVNDPFDFYDLLTSLFNKFAKIKHYHFRQWAIIFAGNFQAA